VQKQTYYGVIACCAVLVGAVAVTNQSLWIDEGAAALKAMEPSLAAWWHNLRVEGNSNLQLIGELFYLWGWEKIFGASEIALRASNIPFFVAGIWALAWGMSPQRTRQTAVVFLALTNAFLWYYLSEARPYIVLFCFASITAACLLQLLRAPEEALESPLWFRLFCVGLLGLCLTSLIAVPWALGAMAAALYWCGPRAITRAVFRFKRSFLVLAIAMAALGFYYLWTMQIGARASGVGRTGWSSVGYIFYELSGLAGLGPGRLQLRTQGLRELASFLPSLALGAGALLVLLLGAVSSIKERIGKREIVSFVLAVAGPLLVVLAAGVSGRMRLLGRHLTPLLPFLLAFLSIGLTKFLASPSSWRKLAGWAALAVFLLSALEIRFAPRHRRDDYRSAAAIAREAQSAGENVWWLADISTGIYYRVPLDSPRLSASPDPLGLPWLPDLVVLSKPDVYDGSGAARAYLAQKNFKVTSALPAFQIWTRLPVLHSAVKSPDKSGE
jgi:hypothetical protein